MNQTEIRKIPSVDAVLMLWRQHAAAATAPVPLDIEIVRAVLDEIRDLIRAGGIYPGNDFVLQQLQARQGRQERRVLQRVINATGIALHTNLGRAPLPRTVLERLTHLASGYCNLEFDLATGKRGKRGAAVNDSLCTLTDAEAALVVNNGAAAVYLVLGALAGGKEVIISRGELVQIGGGFRIPDILQSTGAILREIGTTNITTLKDYEQAVNANTALILRVHRSNFWVNGHTEEPESHALFAMAAAHNIPVAVDLGSGNLLFNKQKSGDPSVHEVLRGGADLVTFSGDKLIGGPQAGIVVGADRYIKRLKEHPLFRVLRPSKLCLFTLQEILHYYLRREADKLPVWQIINSGDAEIKARLESLCPKLAEQGIPYQVVAGLAPVGGGASPEVSLPAALLRLEPADAEKLYQQLIDQAVPIVPRIDRNTILIDLRTVFAEEDQPLVAGIIAAWRACA